MDTTTAPPNTGRVVAVRSQLDAHHPADAHTGLCSAGWRYWTRIDDLLEHLNGAFHPLRQDSIDEELFDVVSSFEALRPDGR